MGEVALSQGALAIDEPDRQAPARLEHPVRLGEHPGRRVYEADGGHDQGVVEAAVGEG